jgi:hypothetical protein
VCDQMAFIDTKKPLAGSRQASGSSL